MCPGWNIRYLFRDISKPSLLGLLNAARLKFQGVNFFFLRDTIFIGAKNVPRLKFQWVENFFLYCTIFVIIKRCAPAEIAVGW